MLIICLMVRENHKMVREKSGNFVRALGWTPCYCIGSLKVVVLQNTLKWDLNRNGQIFFEENGFGKVMCMIIIRASKSLLLLVWDVQYIPRNMHTVFALLCFVVVIHWLIFPYPSGLLHWHCGKLTIAPVPAKQPWWIWINTSCEFIMNDCITTTKQSTTKLCAYFLGYTVCYINYSQRLSCFIAVMWSFRGES